MGQATLSIVHLRGFQVNFWTLKNCLKIQQANSYLQFPPRP